MTRESPFKQRVRARMAKTGESYTTARAQLDTHEAQAAVDGGAGVLHVTNGDTTVELLLGAGLTSPILPWRDILHDGPVPGGLSDAYLRRTRAAFLAEPGRFDAASVERSLAERDRLLDDSAVTAGNAACDLVLWFEADLYDQLQIIQILDRLRRHQVDPGRITLVSAGEFPGVAHFGGLGELQPRDLLRLRDDEISLTSDALDLAGAAWTAFTAADPSGLPTIARTESPVLRYLGEAFGRLMQEYPSCADGLSLTQRRLLLAIEEGAGTTGEAFRELGRRERRPYLGDWPCFDVIAGMASGRQPLLALGEGDEFARRTVELTDAGNDVLAGRADHLDLGGIDRWIGGVHLTDAGDAWRYDERRETLRRT